MSNFSNIFGVKVFNDAVMREMLPKATYKALKKTIDNNEKLAPDVAEVVASVMKDWALEQGATHFSHWFQPMTGITAEKHDSFISPTGDGRVILEFSGKELIMGEPDASSFPNGGIRATFEARGYTIWDCTSPAFVKDNTLCIPTAFASYTGEALDKKTPLLRAMDAINKQGMRVLRALGDNESKKLITYVGAEQEYFIIDKDMFDARKDLKYCGRTLFGAAPSKGQDMDDQYFTAIKVRVMDFMIDLDQELWKLGIPSKTRHNEVAPAQHEIAPIYCTTNVGTDQNQLLMETIKKVAARHDLACLLHEKPFAGVNGSGKHNNWSMGTDTGRLLTNPGNAPHKNDEFLLMLSVVMRAVDKYADAIRSSAAVPGNDHRLGANEAPPAIISIFVGAQLEDIINQIVEKGCASSCISAEQMRLGASTLPDMDKDTTDRNRTSPFAFTGNKFEFRMPGSSQSIAGPNFVINAAIAEVFSEVADRLEGASDVKAEVQKIIVEYMKEHRRIIFNGNGYSEEWVKEAEKRGLPHNRNLVDAKLALIDPKNVKMFSDMGVLSERECHARYEILLEHYVNTIKIEAMTALELAKRDLLPSTFRFITDLAHSINAVKTTGIAANLEAQESLIIEVSELASSAKKKIAVLDKAIEQTLAIDDVPKQAAAFRDNVVTAMSDLRADFDRLELLVDSEYWPLPTYGEMLFSVM
ncbi:MAG: glutamine synthetase III [Spirochaetes bacterium]|nr:glutamine synthetase III [Spirochaetota bacterium]MBN2769399.1 glutamine synthetase III [Spirochaetota bacterium]